MGGAAADPAAAAAFRHIQIAADKTGGEAERAHRLDHQHREIAAAAAAQLQRLDRVLDAAFLARDISQVAADRMGHRRQQLGRVAAPVMTQKLPGPAVDLVLGIEVLPLDQPQQIGHVLGAIAERVARRVLLDLKIERVGRRVIETDDALKAQLRGAPGEAGDRDAIAEHVVDPAQFDRLAA